MKPKRRITAMHKKLLKAIHTDEVKLAQDLLAWVLDLDDTKFEDIIEGIKEPAPRFAADVFKYGVPQPVWTMINPLDKTEIYIADSIPAYTPNHWWKKREIDDIGETIVFAEDFLKIVDEFENDLSWKAIPFWFETYPSLFRSYKEVEKYLSHFYTISYEGKILVSAQERRDVQKETNCNPRNLKTKIEEKYNGKYVYSYKEQGERIWALEKK